MSQRDKRRRQRGFTLIEMLVVLVILGLLAGIVVPNVMGRSEGAKLDTAKAQIQQLTTFVQTYYLDNGKAPQRLQDLVSSPSNASNWNGPYARESQLQDPWGNEYQYRFPGQNSDFDIWSQGPDGNGQDELNNWN